MTAVKRPRPRRPRGSIARDQVVDTALRLADADGLGALSMPSLARELACGVMTLYGYVDDKDDLLDAIAARGLADLRLPRPLPTDSTGLLLAWGRALRETLLQHPSLATLFLSRAVIGPGILRGIEALLGRLSHVGMQPADALQAIYGVVIYTSGFVAWEVPRTVRQPRERYAAAWRRALAEQPSEQLRLTLSVAEGLGGLADAEQFERGLTALARGLTLDRAMLGGMDVFDAVRTLLAVREYADRPVPDDVVQRIVQAGHLTASSMNKQPWHFVVVQQRETLQRLGQLAKTGPYTAQAALAIVVAYEKDSRFGVSDLSRAVQDMMLVAWENGVGSNWAGFGNLPGIGEELGLPDQFEVLAVVPFGYPAHEIGRGQKQRRPLGDVVSRERFGQPFE